MISKCRRRIVATMILAGTAACSRGDDREAWAKWVAAAPHISGSWQASPLNAETIPGSPPCTRTLDIEFDVPDREPAGFSWDGSYGTGSVAFCGLPQEVTVKAVRVGWWSNGSATAPRTGECYYLEVSPCSDDQQVWHFTWLPVGIGGEDREGLQVDFAPRPEPVASSNGMQPFVYSQLLAYDRAP